MNASELSKRGYVASTPAAIYFKSKRGGHYQQSVLCKAKAYLGFDSRGRIQMSFVGNTHSENVKIVVSKYNLLQLILFHLTLKPIQKGSKQTEMWTGQSALKRNGIVPIDLDKMDLDEINCEVQRVRTLLEEVLQSAADKKDQEVAQAQFIKLIEAQYKVSVLKEIEDSKRLLEALQPQKESRKKETMDKMQINESESSKHLHYLSGTWKKTKKKR
ncbi:hypothetical protein [Methanosarcina mazei]|uniref:Uncharacterized protein n=1 Tax=Methanosarcina mazei TaxID=2209 RepID=A0A0F8J5N2_METMZ|nr:hypothetical protein [Methanosarcina mazei]KKG70993.1 hypothetical protein DU63_05810 [Methanosarcina mazei]